MTYKNEIIDIEAEEDAKRYASAFDAISLKFNVGRNHGVQPGNIVAAIIEETGLNGKAIGRIDVRKDFTLVDVEASKVDAVLNNMQRSHIRGVEVMVEIDSAPKRKNITVPEMEEISVQRAAIIKADAAEAMITIHLHSAVAGSAPPAVTIRA